MKPVAYMGVYNSADIREMRTVVMRDIASFSKDMPDTVDPLYTKAQLDEELKALRRESADWKDLCAASRKDHQADITRYRAVMEQAVECLEDGLERS